MVAVSVSEVGDAVRLALPAGRSASHQQALLFVVTQRTLTHAATSTSIWPGTSDLVPDALNYGWRDYGVRVGIWRTIETLDRHNVRASTGAGV